MFRKLLGSPAMEDLRQFQNETTDLINGALKAAECITMARERASDAFTAFAKNPTPEKAEEALKLAAYALASERANELFRNLVVNGIREVRTGLAATKIAAAIDEAAEDLQDKLKALVESDRVQSEQLGIPVESVEAKKEIEHRLWLLRCGKSNPGQAALGNLNAATGATL